MLFLLHAGAVAGERLFTEAIWPFHIIDLNCTGSERTIWECHSNGLLGIYNCPSGNDASIRCQGNVTELVRISSICACTLLHCKHAKVA